MDDDNPVIQLCIRGAEAEFAGRNDEASDLYAEAWALHTDDYEACVAAHYVARFQDSAADVLQWNKIALRHAEAVTDGRADTFFPSLYLNLGRSHETLGNTEAAQRFYAQAAALGFAHQMT